MQAKIQTLKFLPKHISSYLQRTPVKCFIYWRKAFDVSTLRAAKKAKNNSNKIQKLMVATRNLSGTQFKIQRIENSIQIFEE